MKIGTSALSPTPLGARWAWGGCQPALRRDHERRPQDRGGLAPGMPTLHSYYIPLKEPDEKRSSLPIGWNHRPEGYTSVKGGGLPEAVEIAIENIQSRRLALLPPYAYDGDEGEKDVDDYLEFYQSAGSSALRSAEGYRGELLAAREVGSLNEESMRLLDAKRRGFISGFPFSHDELEGLSEDDLKPFLAQLRNIYEKELGSDFILRHLSEYIEDCGKVIEFVEHPALPTAE
jgi:hypothetical protein